MVRCEKYMVMSVKIFKKKRKCETDAKSVRVYLQ
jgi:hypothetical protein